MIQNSITTHRQRFFATVVPGLTGALMLAACTSAPIEPTVAVKAAEQAIAAADQTRVADAASPELAEAREKLTAARSAVAAKKMLEAERLAIESRADAELSSAKTESAKAAAVNEEIKQSTATLAQEMQRNAGAKQ